MPYRDRPPAAAAHAFLEVDPVRRTVRRGEVCIELTARAHALLVALATQPDRVHDAASLKAMVWPGRVVEDGNLRVQVQTLRTALGREMVLNVPGRGYRLGMPVRLLQPERPTTNLPHWTEPLLGRDGEAAQLAALLPSHRLVSVVGPGGVGKTRLAQHVAPLAHAHRPQGTWWVDLATVPAGAAAPAACAQAIAQALGLHVSLGPADAAAATLVRALAGWHGLLLLDNAEHLCDGPEGLARLVRALLEGTDAVRLLLTSQQPLRLPEEWVMRLGPLPVPPPQARTAELRDCGAMQLLERRARAADESYRLMDGELHEAAAMLRQLDGIPLAIEVVAPRLPLLGLALVQQELRARRHLRVPAGAAGPARQRTLQAALAWSDALLTPPERTALRWLSVFVAPFRLEAARQLVAGAGLDEHEALAAIVGLADKSLLQRTPTTPGQPARLRWLETLRHHAAQGLAEAGPQPVESARRAHLQAMADLAAQAKRALDTASDDEWAACWVPDLDDMLAAFDRAVELRETEAAGTLIELLVLSANVTGRVDPMLARADAAQALAEGAPPLARARLLGWATGVAAHGPARLAAAARRVQVWRAVDGPEGRVGLCLALARQALLLEEAGDAAAADAALAECLALEDPLWSPRLRRRCSWLALARMAARRGDVALLAQADARARQLVEQLQTLEAWREGALVQAQVADAWRAQKRLDEALALLRSLQAAQRARGCEVDAAIHQGACCAVLTSMLERGGPARLEAEALQAGQQALAGLGPLPAMVRHFIDALAVLAWRGGDPDHAALLQAAGERLCQRLQLEPDPLQAGLRASVARALAALEPARRQLAAQRGRALDEAGLRAEALAWLQRRPGRPGRPRAGAEPASALG